MKVEALRGLYYFIRDVLRKDIWEVLRVFLKFVGFI